MSEVLNRFGSTIRLEEPPSIATIPREHAHYWSCLALFIVAFVLSESTLVIPFVSDHLSNFAATGIMATLVMGRSRFHQLNASGVIRAAGVTVALAVIELLADGPMFLIEGDGMRFLGFINTVDPVDAVFGLMGGLTVLGLSQAASTRLRSSPTA